MGPTEIAAEEAVLTLSAYYIAAAMTPPMQQISETLLPGAATLAKLQ